MTTPIRRLTADATGQLGAFNREQAHAAGLSDGQLRRRIQSGILDQPGPHTFRSTLSPRSALGDLVALVVDVGPPCWVSGPTAAALHGFDGFPLRPPFHLTVLRDRNVHRVGSLVHTTLELPLIDRAHAKGLDVLSGARTVIDLARQHDPEALARALDCGLRDGLFNEDLLHRRIVALRRKGRYGIPALLDVLAGDAVTRGGHSWLERRFLQLAATAGLPRPDTQQVLTKAGDRMVRVDCRFADTPVVVELLGYRFHTTRQQLANDSRRLNALILDGFLPYQFTYEQVVAGPDGVIASVRAALAAAGRRSA
ncbi:MAG: type IV toxin-antitoxin system AbiEi family antitoxin domain-containing protein [Actinomycetota bacterium]|nr:type IV toxin-antitoxin system AbiEi family antitoxin domain-containing protein [Actinomycetota bacterium]